MYFFFTEPNILVQQHMYVIYKYTDLGEMCVQGTFQLGVNDQKL